MMEEARLRCQTRMAVSSLGALAEEPEQDVESLADILKADLKQKASRATLADGVAERANTISRVVNCASVWGISVDQIERLREAP